MRKFSVNIKEDINKYGKPSAKTIFTQNNTNYRYSHSLNKKRNFKSFEENPIDSSIFYEPEKNSQRKVVFIKTYMISPFQSISIEISYLYRCLLIIGKMFGL